MHFLAATFVLFLSAAAMAAETPSAPSYDASISIGDATLTIADMEKIGTLENEEDKSRYYKANREQLDSFQGYDSSISSVVQPGGVVDGLSIPPSPPDASAALNALPPGVGAILGVNGF